MRTTSIRPKGLQAADMLRCGLLAWLLAVSLEYLLLSPELRTLSTLAGLSHMSLPRCLLLTAVFALCFLLCGVFTDVRRFQRWLFPGIFAIYGAAALHASFSWVFLAVILGVLGVLAVYALRGWQAKPVKLPESLGYHRGFLWVTVIFTLAFFILVSVWTVCRVYSFSTPTYDFGIFSQMFYSMKTTGLPMTTVERDGMLSHFAVHVSPIYYLLLPFYCLLPIPATLQVLQAAVLASAVIPLWKICGLHGLSGFQRMLCCLALLLYPAFSGGVSYDIHENCFLTPLLLWLFYALDRRIPWLAVLSLMLTLMVKEDAAVYTAVIGLWQVVSSLLRREKPWRGAAILAVSIAWFCAVTGFLADKGDGVMTGRYDNFMFGENPGLGTVILTVFLQPIRVLRECVEQEKLGYIALTLGPLLGLPLLTRRFERCILLIPYVLVNLMTDYRYQHDIGFQYNFGSLACLFYLTVLNLAEWKPTWRRSAVLILMAAACAGCFGGKILPTAVQYPQKCLENREEYGKRYAQLSMIPEGASVSATTFLTTALSQRETLFDIRYGSFGHILESEYVVLDPSTKADFKQYAREGRDGLAGFLAFLEENGYSRISGAEDPLLVYQRSPQVR